MAFPSYDLQGLSQHAQHRLGRQVESLTRDVGHIADSLRRFGGGAGKDIGQIAHNVADEAMHQGAEVAKLVGEQAYQAGRAIRRDPLPTIMAVAGLACLLSLLMSSGKKRPTIH
jgi:hypothetical protein